MLIVLPLYICHVHVGKLYTSTNPDTHTFVVPGFYEDSEGSESDVDVSPAGTSTTPDSDDEEQ